MKCSLGISNFLEEISSLSHSIYCFPLFLCIDHWGRLSYVSLELLILWNAVFKWVYRPFSPLPFGSLLFSAICKASSDDYFVFLHFFPLGIVLIMAPCTMLWISVHSYLGTTSDLIPWICLSLPLYNHKIWYRSYLNGLVVFTTLLNLSLDFAIKSSWSEPHSAPGLFLLTA